MCSVRVNRGGRPPTELECVVLAQVRRLQPCTPHEVRRSFADSTSGRYSDSAGSIYPLLKRLQASGFLSARKDKRGRQARSLVSCTRAGVAEIKAWLMRMEAKRLFPDDPLRTRFQYIDVLSKAEQRAWFAEARALLDAQAAAVGDEYAGTPADDVINTAVVKNVMASIALRAAFVAEADALSRKAGRMTLGPTTGRNVKSYRPIAGEAKQRSKGR
jgi:DNA-binding PadR family transcriptional regulator